MILAFCSDGGIPWIFSEAHSVETTDVTFVKVRASKFNNVVAYNNARFQWTYSIWFKTEFGFNFGFQLR